MVRKLLLGLLWLGISVGAWAQTGKGIIRGNVTAAGSPLGWVAVGVPGTAYGATTGADGAFKLENIPYGTYEVRCSFTGYSSYRQTVTLSAAQPAVQLAIELKELQHALDEVVVTGTRTARKRTESPVAVDVIGGRLFEITQSASLKEGLCFQPGLRVETDCQTCNYSQVRMNGLGGSYTQILINSRPVFSALNGLYGLEQMPANMIDRVEIVRGGGSALYGSSAIAGTVNIITKDPERDSWSAGYNYANTGGSSDHIFNANASAVHKSRKAGVTLFASRRYREEYDHNGDGFSELPRINNLSFGLNSFLKTGENAKLSLSLNHIGEERDGGDQLDLLPHQRQQTEWRNSNTLTGTVSYDLKLPAFGSTLSVYAGGQTTRRRHYTGLEGTDGYGNTENETFQGGIQYNYTPKRFLLGKNILTAGVEYQYDNVFDQIPGYNYLIDQQVGQLGAFVQSDWELTPKWTLLTGLRVNRHNFVDRLIANPRLGLLFKPTPRMQLRASYANGFRAPQAFDTDMHVAFANGGVSLIRLDPALRPEFANSFSASLDYDRPAENYIYGFTASAFHTRLRDPFVLEEVGEDADGNKEFSKRNGGASAVTGLSVEGRLNWNQLVEADLGLTVQQSRYDEPVAWSAAIPGTRRYLRAPNQYGYYTVTLTPSLPWTFSVTGVYTGPMLVPHFGGAPGVDGDRLVTSRSFVETNLKAAYTLKVKSLKQSIQFFGGVQNVFNQYQNDFDTGPSRDSNYIYGPGRPRTFFAGIKLGMF